VLRQSRAFAWIVSIALIGAALSPLLRRPDDDGFPLSTYPMFASARPRQLTMSYPLGATAGGGRRYLSPELVGSSEPLQAAAIVERAIAQGRGAIRGLCEAIARRVAASGAHRDVAAIRLVTGTHDAVELLARDRVGAEVEHGRCAVPRSEP
jgi:hypothetical protein